VRCEQLDVLVQFAPVDLVFDAVVREVHLPVEVRQVVVARPRPDLVLAPVGAATVSSLMMGFAWGMGSVMVPVVDDDVAESSEQFQVLLSNPRGASLLADAVTVTITDTDPVVIRPGGAGVVEGDDGTVTVDVPVSLSAPSASPVTVEWSTFDPGGSGLATSGVDYVAASGTVTFAPGETAASVRLTVNGDRVDEPDLLWGEWALVRFSNPSANATVDTAFYGLGIGVIFDDDPAPTIRPGGAGVVEGDDGTVTVDVPVTLSNPSASPVTVQWSTFDPGGSGVAAAGVDYEVASGTVTFAPGQTTAVVRLTVVGDTVVEPPLLWGEWVFVAFSSPVNATLDTSFYGLGIAVILDDDDMGFMRDDVCGHGTCSSRFSRP